MERFAKAVGNVLKRFVERGIEVVDIKEIWIDSSIPLDMIEEMIKKGLVEIPNGIVEIRKGRSVLWKRSR